MKKFFLLFFLLNILISCTCVETNLTKEEREWFRSYEQNQIVVFRSNLGNLDTLNVIEKLETHNNKDCNYFGIGKMQPNIMFIKIQSNICHNPPYCEGEIFISKETINQNYIPSFSLFGLIQNSELQNESLQVQKIKLTTTDKLYQEVYHFEDGINAKNFGNSFLKSFYWDKKEGLIRYDTSEGEVFELLKK